MVRTGASPAELSRSASSEPAPRSWRDPVQAAIALKARKGKFRRRTKSCLCCGLIFVIAVIALVMLATLAAQDAGHAGHDAATLASNATNGTLVARVRKTVRSKVEKIVVTSSCTIGLLLLAGHLIRGRSKWLRALHLPASVVGGMVGFCFFGAVEACGAGDLADDWFADGWSVLPGFCTNIIFCSLFIGTRVPHPSEILASPRREHFLYGLIVVFGQWSTSCLCTIVFGFFTELNGPFATVMPYGYAGGPVVAEAMKDLYAEDSFNYPDGYSLALLAATVGMFVGVIAGALLVNFAPLSTGLAAEDRPSPSASADAAHQPGPSRSGVLPRVRASASKMGNALLKLKETAPESDHYAAAERPSAGQQSVSVESMDTLVFHLCLVMLVMLLGSPHPHPHPNPNF